MRPAIFMLLLAAASLANAELHVATPAETLLERHAAIVHASHGKPVAQGGSYDDPGGPPEGGPGPGFDAATARVFNVNAFVFDYTVTPAPFVVNRGDSVTINLTASDNGSGLGHGFFLETYAEANNFIRQSQNVQIQFVAHTAGTFTFLCTQTCGIGHTTMDGIFTVNEVVAEPAPAIASITPTTGSTAGGTSVTITGTNLRAGATVTFGGVAATNVNVVSATSITATTPAHGAGAAAVVVRNSDGQAVTAAQQFTYAEPLPAITSVTPASDSTAGGTSITVRGERFTSGATLTIGGVAAHDVTFVDATTITARTPLGPADIGGTAARDVVVTNPGGVKATLINGFTWNVPAPAVAAVEPNTGPDTGGARVLIRGAGFTSALQITVTFGGVAATEVTVIDATTLAATIPAHAVGPVDVRVVVGGANATATNGFSYREPVAKRRSVKR